MHPGSIPGEASTFFYSEINDLLSARPISGMVHVALMLHTISLYFQWLSESAGNYVRHDCDMKSLRRGPFHGFSEGAKNEPSPPPHCLPLPRPGQGMTPMPFSLVDNPFFQPGHPESNANPRKTVVRVRPSAVHSLAVRGKLLEHQRLAAARFEGIYWAVESGGVKAVDYGRIMVDGGAHGDGMAPGRLDAAKQLAEVRNLLGKTCFQIVANVCGNGADLKNAGLGSDKTAMIVASNVLKFCLDDLAEAFGYLRR